MKFKRKAAGLLIIFLTLSALGVWEFWGRQELMYEDILVLRDELPEGALVKKRDLKTVSVEKANPGALREKDIPGVIGMVTDHYIPAETELYPQYFKESIYITGEKTDRYVFSLPEEWLIAYPVSLKRGDKAFFYCDGKPVTDAVVVHVKDSRGQEISYESEERKNNSGEIDSIEIIADSHQLEKLGKLAAEDRHFVLAYY